MRAFLAITPPTEVQAGCRELIDALRPDAPKVRWVRPENIHLTLRFLGDIDESVGERVMHGLAETAATVAPFAVTASGFGCFPNARKPTVAWVGIQAEGEGLQRVQSAAEEAAQRLGLKPETRPFSPHLTIGRIRVPAPAVPWAELIARHADFNAGAWTVRDVALFSSELHPSGARYTRIATVSLGKNWGQ